MSGLPFRHNKMNYITSTNLHFASPSRFGWGLVGVIFLLSLAIMAMVTLLKEGFSQTALISLFQSAYFKHSLIVTFQQAFLSVLGASVFGIAGAVVFYRRAQFPLRRFILAGCFISMIMPTTVAALALLKLWGKSGFFATIGLDSVIPDRLGLWSVILAHIFFNAPLIMRVCLSALERLPLSQRRQAAMMGLSALSHFRYLEWPAIRHVLPSIMGLVLLLCVTSFSLILMLGGGPAVTTLEVSIYTALRFDFDVSKAAILCLIQLGICSVILLSFKPSSDSSPTAAIDTPSPLNRPDSKNRFVQFFDIAIITFFIILNIVPLLLLLADGDYASGFYILATERFWNAFGNSVALACLSALLSLFMSYILVCLAHEAYLRALPFMSKLIEVSHSVFLLVPAIVLGTSLFILLRAYIDVFSQGFWIMMLGNALLSLPFCYRIIAPSLLRHLKSTDRLCASLHISGLARFIHITAPAMQIEFSFAFGLAAALSFGDLGIITLFGSQNFETLPYMLFQYLNRYGAVEADILALILLLMALTLYGIAQKLPILLSRLFKRSV